MEKEVERLRSLLGVQRRPAHSLEGLPVRAPDANGNVNQRPHFKTILCRYHQEGRCSKGGACTYAHGERELRRVSPHFASREPANYKTVLCEFFQHGSCRYGPQCTFAHGTSDLRTSQGSSASHAVKNWLKARSLCCQAGLSMDVANTMEGQTEIAGWRQRLQDAKARRLPFVLPPSRCSADRKVIHMICEELGIQHESRGAGASRCIDILFDDVAPASSSLMPAIGQDGSHGESHYARVDLADEGCLSQGDYEYDDFFDLYLGSDDD